MTNFPRSVSSYCMGRKRSYLSAESFLIVTQGELAIGFVTFTQFLHYSGEEKYFSTLDLNFLGIGQK